MKLNQKHLLWGLLFSVGLNLFLLGFLLARDFGLERQPHPRRGGGGMFRTDELFGLERTPEARELMREHKSKMRPQRRALREARNAVKRALEAEPFEHQRLEQALAKLRDETTAMQGGMHEALTDLASSLTTEQRRDLVKRNFERRRKRRPRREPEQTTDER